MKVYVDMDGVITDFPKQLADLLNRKLDRKWDFGSDPKIWKKIEEAGVSFWADMPWMPSGKKLWTALKKYKPIILSSPSRDFSSIQGKKKWIAREIPGTPYIIEWHKHKYAEPNAILIDDRIKKINKWEESGGIGILHKGADNTIKKLKDIMSKNKKSKEGSDMKDLIERIDKIAQSLEDSGYINDSFELDKISDALEKYAQFPVLERIKAPGIREFFVESKFGPVKLVKSVLRDLKDPKATKIYSLIEDAEKVKMSDTFAVDEIKKKIREAALEYSMQMAEFISLFLKLVEEGPGHPDFRQDKNLLYRLAPRISPKEIVRKDPFKSYQPSGFSRTFYEMAKRASEIDLSGLSDEHLKIASECLVNVIGTLNSKIDENRYVSFDGKTYVLGHDENWTWHSDDGLNWTLIKNNTTSNE